MKRFKESLFLLLIISLPLILLHCTKYKEEAPFFEGLFLEYDWGGGTREKYNVHVIDNNRFKITETRKREPLSDDVEEFLVDAYGKVYKSSYRPYKGKFSPIWIPAHKMEIGDTFDGRKLVERKDKWEKWEVLVVKDTPTGGESYFELNTGYLVGSFAKTAIGVGKIILLSTNADIPTIQE